MLNEKNFSLEEIKKRLDSIYNEALSLIKQNYDFAQQNEKNSDPNTNVKDKAMLNLILKLLNDYEEASLKYISSLMQDNSKLKSALRTVHSMLDIYFQKSNEIIKIDKVYENNITHIHRRGTEITDFINETTNLNEEYYFEGQNSTILNNLNIIRDQVSDMSEKIELQKNYISTLKEKSKKEKSERDCLNLIVQVPKWMPDDYITHCMKCEKPFSYGRWKHHCRVCGDIFCANCCSHYHVFEPFFLDPVRTCENCHLQKKYNKYR